MTKHSQVLLQPRGLLLMCGEAYTHAMHSIPSQETDVITPLCANKGLLVGVTEVHLRSAFPQQSATDTAENASHSVPMVICEQPLYLQGDVILRAPRRKSLVFVHKLQSLE